MIMYKLAGVSQVTLYFVFTTMRPASMPGVSFLRERFLDSE